MTYLSYMTQELRDLLQNLLRVDPVTRYGSLRNGAADIKSHTWFNGTEWLDIYHKKVIIAYLTSVNLYLQFCRPCDTYNGYFPFRSWILEVVSNRPYILNEWIHGMGD